MATILAATSTAATGTVNKRAIQILAAYYGNSGVRILDSPVIVSGAGPPALGQSGSAAQGHTLAMAALIHAAGGRKDVQLRTGGSLTGGDQMLTAAARRLGWLPPKIFAADPDAWCHGCYPLGASPGHRKTSETGTGTYCPAAEMIRNSALVAASPLSHRGVVLLQPGRKNAAALDCAVKMMHAGIQVTCWCPECGPTAPLAGPCPKHSLPGVTEFWQEQEQAAA
jgi:hypothetical protein